MSTPADADRRRLILTAGMERFQAGDFAAAAGHFHRVLENAPDDADALHLLGLALFQQGDAETAVGHVEAALARAGDNEDMLLDLGQLRKAAGDSAAAADAFRRALAMNPGNADALIKLGGALIDARDFAGAEESLRRALTASPGNREAAGNLGVALYGLGRADEALVSFGQVLAADPGDAIALAAQGAIRFEQGAFADAAASLARAAERDSRFDYGRACLFGDDFLIRADPARFAAALAALPAVNGTPPAATGDAPVVMTSGDHGYFRKFVLSLVLSVDRFAPGHDVHVHVINPQPSFAGELAALSARLRATALTATTEMAPGRGTLYYPVARFIRLARFVNESDRDVLHLDADSLVRHPFRALAAIEGDADLAVPMRFDDFVLKYKVLISSLFVRNTTASRLFLRRYGAYLADCVERDRLVWCLDQTAFYIVARMMGFVGEDVTVRDLPVSLCDHALNPASDVWAAKGELKDNPAYATACEALLST